MPEAKPRKTPSQKENERRLLQADIDAYMAAGGQISPPSAPVADSSTSNLSSAKPVRTVPTP